MNISTALELTKAKNKPDLAKKLNIHKSAVYQWDEDSIPEKSELKILRLVGLAPKENPENKNQQT